MNRIAYLILLAFLGGCAISSSPNENDLVSQIQRDLPPGWQCTVIQKNGEKGHPHGLGEPMIRMDLSSPDQSFPNAKGARRKTLSPLIQLFLYHIADKPHVLEVIEKERLYSWDIPIYFGETEDYIIVTSPPYVNHGVFTEVAKQTIRPMWDVLRRHIPNKGDKSVDQLAQPDN